MAGREIEKRFVQVGLISKLASMLHSEGLLFWLRKNLFSSVTSTIATVALLLLFFWITTSFLDFLWFSAVFRGADGSVCRAPGAGACWPFITHKMGIFVYGLYPLDERWRVNIFFLTGALLLFLLLTPVVPFKRLNAILFFIVYPIFSFFLLYGGVFGLPTVESSSWGGILVTMIVGLTAIVFSLPIGIILALGRQSALPFVKSVCIVFIEIWRGVPLITVLFMATVMFPLFLPEGVSFDKLLRCLVGATLFSSAYMAEVVRGGLQAIPAGQYDAAKMLGLKYWQRMILIVLPQALKMVIPGIVNSFIAMFKDTTLVLIVGIIDFLGSIQSSSHDPAWLAPNVAVTGYVFAALFFWVCCSAMSRYSAYWERRLNTDYRV